MSPRLDSRWVGSSLTEAGISPAGSAGLYLAHRTIHDGFMGAAFFLEASRSTFKNWLAGQDSNLRIA
jgi:hypothetical protein